MDKIHNPLLLSPSIHPCDQVGDSSGGVAVGVACGVLGLVAVLLGAGYYAFMKYTNRWVSESAGNMRF